MLGEDGDTTAIAVFQLTASRDEWTQLSGDVYVAVVPYRGTRYTVRAQMCKRATTHIIATATLGSPTVTMTPMAADRRRNQYVTSSIKRWVTSKEGTRK